MACCMPSKVCQNFVEELTACQIVRPSAYKLHACIIMAILLGYYEPRYE